MSVAALAVVDRPGPVDLAAANPVGRLQAVDIQVVPAVDPSGPGSSVPAGD